MTQTGKFDPLQHEKWVKACQKLIPNHHPRKHFFDSQTEFNKLAEVACLSFDVYVTSEVNGGEE
jgi:hypothetical protein